MKAKQRIVFFDATWSGASQLARKNLEALNKARLAPANLEFIDVDTDDQMQLRNSFPGGIHGWGEAVIVENNQLVFSTRLGKPVREIEQKIQALFTAYDS